MALDYSANNKSSNGQNGGNKNTKQKPMYKAKVDKDLIKHRKLKFDELGRTDEEFKAFYAYELYVEPKKKKKKKWLLDCAQAAHNFKMILGMVATKTPLEDMNLIQLAQFYMRMCYFPGELMKQGFKSKEQMVDAFYSVFSKLDRSQQQFIEYRFSFEVDRLKQTQKLEMTDRTISQALYKKETTANSVIKDTLHYVSSTSIGNYSNKDTYTMKTDLEDQVERSGYSKKQIKEESKTTYTSTTTLPTRATVRNPRTQTRNATHTRTQTQDMGRDMGL